MSLWKVDDTATRLLMSEFYRNYLSGKSKQESLRLAQQWLREIPKYSSPEYWAAFILLDALN
jgi:CHAT domain-containing protein